MSAISPIHYQSHPSGLECIEVTRHQVFTVGNAIKYLWRAGLKDDRWQEVEKARQYLAWAQSDRATIHVSDTTRQWQNWYRTQPKDTHEDRIINVILSGNIHAARLSVALLLTEVDR